MNSGVENAMEVWHPLSRNALAIVIIGGYWLTRGRAPRVLLIGFVSWLVVYGALTEVGRSGAVQAWALRLVS